MKKYFSLFCSIVNFIFSPSMLFILAPIIMIGFFVYITVKIWSYGFIAPAIGFGFLAIIVIRHFFTTFEILHDVEKNEESAPHSPKQKQQRRFLGNYRRSSRRYAHDLKKQPKEIVK